MTLFIACDSSCFRRRDSMARRATLLEYGARWSWLSSLAFVFVYIFFLFGKAVNFGHLNPSPAIEPCSFGVFQEDRKRIDNDFFLTFRAS